MPRKKYKNFLVTGISGYYGSSLLRHISQTKPPAKIVGIDIKKPGARYPFLDFRKMNILDPGLEDVLISEEIDTVVHLAFAVNVFAPDRKIRDVNIKGTRNVLDCSVRAGVRKFVLISSSTAYGAFEDNEDFLDEEKPIRASRDFFYTRDKVDIESMVDAYRRENESIKFVVIRPAIITGSAMHPALLKIFKILHFIPVVAGRDPELQFVHEDDLARATWLLMRSHCQGAYNVTGDGGVPTREMMRLCGKRPLPLPRGIMVEGARLIQKLGLAPPIAGFVDLLSFPWTVSNEKLKKDFDFVFEYDSRAAVQEFAARL